MKAAIELTLAKLAQGLRAGTLAAGLLMSALGAHAQGNSYVLAETLRNGAATVNLLNGADGPVAPAQLESLRQEHQEESQASPRNFLSIGLDIREVTRGMENSRSQAITIDQVSLTVIRASGTTIYTRFRTRTQALVAPAGSSQRRRYYTALGETAGVRPLATNAIQRQFDSTLDVFVEDSLADATSATLSIRLLSTNTSKGDPELFYDYTGDDEVLAVLNRSDAYFLNTTLPRNSSFTRLAPIAEIETDIHSNDSDVREDPDTEWMHFPSASGWYFVAYEDSYPNKADYDFNDTVVAYRYKLGRNSAGKVIRVEVESYLLADGAWNTLDWNFRLPIAGSVGSASCRRSMPDSEAEQVCVAAIEAGQLNATPFDGIDNTGKYFEGSNSWATNVSDVDPINRGAYAAMEFELSAALPLAVVGNPDPWLFVRESGQSIHLGALDASGIPFALLLPTQWRIAREHVDFGDAYPRFKSYAQSGGTADRDWYLYPAENTTIDIGSWAWKK